MTLNSKDSLRTAIAVNVAKLTLLAALAPPVIAGIAQRASALGDGFDVAAIVATTVSLGSATAIVGALLLGFLSDVGSRSPRARWAWIASATTVGTVGLILLAHSETQTSLTLGWMLAQFGYSGAMAVLRVVLADALPQHRRRGAVVVVLGSYGGLVLPLLVLLLFPTRLWETTFGLALLSLAVPLAMLTLMRNHSKSRTQSEEEAYSLEAAGHPTPIPRLWLLVIQCAANVVVTVFLSYHPLELAQKTGADISVRTTVIVVVCAVVGILLSTSILLWKPALLTRSDLVIGFSGILLGSSLVIRAATESLWLISFTALLSGAAVGLNSSALFNAALEHARSKGGGKLMGVYSAAGAFGQVIGPVLALGILWAISGSRSSANGLVEYQTLFFVLAVLPFLWAAITLSSRSLHRFEPRDNVRDLR